MLAPPIPPRIWQHDRNELASIGFDDHSIQTYALIELAEELDRLRALVASGEGISAIQAIDLERQIRARHFKHWGATQGV